MFTDISWSNYFITIITLSATYYLIIIYLFYRHDLLRYFSMQQAYEKQDIQSLRPLSEEIRAYLNEAGRNALHKEDIVRSLNVLLARYPGVKDLKDREFIQKVIQTNCSIHLSEEELSALW